MMAKLICIKTYNNRAEVDLAKSLLENEGIRAVISGDFSVMPPLELAMGLRLLVGEEDVKKATELLSTI